MYNNEETIYNLIPKEYVPPPKEKQHKSRYNPSQPPTGSTFVNYTTSRPKVANVGGNTSKFQGPHTHKGKRSTMGKLRGHLKPNATNYQKKFTGTMGGTGIGKQTKRPKTIELRKKTKIYRKPPVVARDDQPIMGLKSNKNFIISNAVENILAPPKTIPNKQNYRNKKDYGKLPKYLRQIKENIATEYQTIKQMQQMEDEMRTKEKYLLSPQEVKTLKEGLKKKMKEVQIEFQSITHKSKIDTLGLKFKMESCIEKLKQLEKDLKLLSRPFVFIDTQR